MPPLYTLQEDVYTATPSEGMCDVVLGVASVAKGHLDEARVLARRLPKQVRVCWF